uniref:G-protein coupled receptors family 1 profile domain-containing protein n=1 Tax=Clastoptera arizonana TaxID=38151 RepID=A0A1B6D3F5_9HEMI
MAPSENEFVINIILIFILIVATASNSLVLLVFYRKPALRTLSNRFVINLLATNLLSCWVLLPLILVDSVWGKVSPVMCGINQGISTGLCSASVMSVLLIGIDQYFAVIDPLHYHSVIDNPRCAMMTIISWIFSLSIGIIGGMLYGTSSFWYFCGEPDEAIIPLVPNIYLTVFSIVYSILVFVLPFSCLCWVYVSIYSAAHKNSQRTRRNGSSAGFYIGNSTISETPSDYSVVPTTQMMNSVQLSTSEVLKTQTKIEESTDASESNKPKPTLTRSPTKTSLKSTSSFIVNSLRYRISNASMFKYREETRAARISILVIVMALVCWLPFTSVLILNSPLINIIIPHLYGKLSVTFLASTSIISTLIFAHRNRRIQRDISKIFGLVRQPTNIHTRQNILSKKGVTQKTTNRVLPPNYSHNALENLSSLEEAKDEAMHDEKKDELKKSNKLNFFLVQMWYNKPDGYTPSNVDDKKDKQLIGVPEVALDIETSRSSFSSGGSSAQRSTSAASFSSVAEDL